MNFVTHSRNVMLDLFDFNLNFWRLLLQIMRKNCFQNFILLYLKALNMNL